jgi:repressor LexA
MNLALPGGAKVIIEPGDTALRDGKIYAVMNDFGETTLKFFRADPARLEPSSSNPEHQPIMLGTAPFRVIGRATQIIMAL